MRTKFKRLREAKRKPQLEFAVENGVSLTTLCGWESGRIACVSFKTAQLLANAYGVSVEEIEKAFSPERRKAPAA